MHKSTVAGIGIKKGANWGAVQILTAGLRESVSAILSNGTVLVLIYNLVHVHIIACAWRQY